MKLLVSDQEKEFQYWDMIGAMIDQSIDIALRSGKRESLIISDKYENYFSIYLSIMTGEKWFMKRRRK